MGRVIREISILILCLLGTTALSAQDHTDFRRLLKLHCVSCHGPEKSESDFRLDNLPLQNMTADHIESWQQAIDRVIEREMPPNDQPALSDQEVTHFRSYLSPILGNAVRAVPRGSVVLRRLNAVQYDNTIRDLLGLDVSIHAPSSSLPKDETVDGFDNVGDGLSMSDIHLETYIASANTAVQRWREQAKVEYDSIAIRHPDLSKARQYGSNSPPVTSEHPYIDLLFGSWDNRRFKSFQIPTGKGGLVPYDGTYRITIDMEALHTDDAEGLRLGQQVASSNWRADDYQMPRVSFFMQKARRNSRVPPIDRRVATFQVDHHERRTFTQEVWLPRGEYSMRINFDTGSRFEMRGAVAHFRIRKELGLDNPQVESKREYAELFSKYKNKSAVTPDWRTYMASLPLPRIRIHDLVIEGPTNRPENLHPDYFDRLDTDPSFRRRELAKLAQRVFRRPVSNAELSPYTSMANERGFDSALKALLCSPSFLYLSEDPGQLDDYAIANRLSYFLWNSMPDGELFDLAKAGRLHDKKVLRAQVVRMLSDDKSQSFARRFTHHWLGLSNMDDMPPDGKAYGFYTDHYIKDLYREESQLFFEHLVATNAPAADLLHADYTFMNGMLAKFYGITNGPRGKDFEKVSLAAYPRRRGFLGQGAVLTTSANGVDTSPVVRGIWVLKNLLGTPPLPPPDDVPAIEPDTRGTTTIREMLAAHRTVDSCARCHKDIDPLGFALESFDVVGLWRDEYANGRSVESFGKVPNGAKFDDIVGLRLLMRGNAVRSAARHLVDRLLVCATGRQMSVGDDAEIDRIIAEEKPDGMRVRSLLMAVVTSDIFLTK